MNKKYNKRLSGFLALVMMLSVILVGMPEVVRAEEQTFVETFDNFSETSKSYVNGSFVGVNNITWNYEGARGDLEGYEIDGKGVLFRRPSDGARIYANIEGGISSFSVDTKKAFTGTGKREIELLINEESQGTFTLNNDNEDVQVFEVKDINIEGPFKLEIKHIGASSGGQLVIDNITWTSYSSGGEEVPLESLTISGPTEVQERSTIKLDVEYNPENTTQKGVTWTSSNEDIATVNTSGTVTGVSEGETTITATSTHNEGVSVEHTVNVTAMPISTISAIREFDKGVMVSTEGIVTGDIDTTMYIQDEEAGIAIYKNNIGIGEIVVGEKVKVVGITDEFNGLKQIKLLQAGDIEFLGEATVPAPKTVTIDQVNTDAYQGQLVKIENVTIGAINTGGNTLITDENGNKINIFKIPELTGVEEGNKINIIAIASIFNTPQLRVRSASDITKVEEEEPVNPDPKYPVLTQEATKTEDKLEVKLYNFEEDMDGIVIIKVLDENGKPYIIDYKDTMNITKGENTVYFTLDSAKYTRGISGVKVYVWKSFNIMKPFARQKTFAL